MTTLGLTGCTLASTDSDPTPSPTATKHPFTVMSTDPIRVVDPAAVTEPGSAVLTENVFQRLMTAAPGADVLKPDAARDCLFTAATVYTCTLNQELEFSNGHPLTSSDIKFSIERATRLAVPGSSASLLSSLRRIETPDPLTARFVLSRVDTQFGWALASPAASVVDEELYDADEVQAGSDPIIGSGPFTVTAIDASSVKLSRFENYVGRTPARMGSLVYRTAQDSAAIEAAMTAGTVDVVWRGLSSAALIRLSQQVRSSAEELTADRFSLRTLPGIRVRQLLWNPSSANRNNPALRRALPVALQEDRTSDSVVPAGIPGHTSSFAAGGNATPKVSWSNRIQLTLGYDATMPDGRDLANQIRTRLEDTGGLSVRVRPDDPSADLQLVDRKAWTATALAWLQPYLDSPLAGSRPTVSALETKYRASTQDGEALQLLAALQDRAALDAVVLPVSQGDENLLVRAGVEVSETSWGPGWQLGLFGMKDG
ncbi:MAG TPA: ABC transporter substrate-binding protein [Propionibacteriaceae bacterium]|nr:ABC transporter substrate-binding protein [Propionibacteriaceae bacterium]